MAIHVACDITSACEENPWGGKDHRGWWVVQSGRIETWTPHMSFFARQQMKTLIMNSTRIAELVEKATSPDLKSADMESINALIS